MHRSSIPILAAFSEDMLLDSTVIEKKVHVNFLTVTFPAISISPSLFGRFMVLQLRLAGGSQVWIRAHILQLGLEIENRVKMNTVPTAVHLTYHASQSYVSCMACFGPWPSIF